MLVFIALATGRQTNIAATDARTLPRFQSAEIDFSVLLLIFSSIGEIEVLWATVSRAGQYPTHCLAIIGRLRRREAGGCDWLEFCDIRAGLETIRCRPGHGELRQ